MAYHEQSFYNRLQTMGDQAEDILDRVAPFGNMEAFGWNRPSVTMANMSLPIRHLPDRYATGGELIEAMGCGRDGTLKFKLVKYEGLKHWAGLQPLWLFVFNSHLSRYAVIPWSRVKVLVGRARRAGVLAFHDDNEYYPIQWSWIEDDKDCFVEEVPDE